MTEDQSLAFSLLAIAVKDAQQSTDSLPQLFFAIQNFLTVFTDDLIEYLRKENGL